MKPRSRCSLASRFDCLEARTLRAGDVAPGLDVIRDLGAISVPAAIAGVEATATIAPQGSVTFDFQVRTAGIYTLLVRYEGAGLGLTMSDGGGMSRTVQAGPPGRLAMVDLTLDGSAEQIKASATGRGPVFVDWELFLNSGVGQGAATGVGLASGPSVSIPTPASPVATTHAPAGTGGQAPAIVIGGPVGRSDGLPAIASVGPGGAALVYSGDGLPEGLVLDLTSESIPEPAEATPGRPVPTLELFEDQASAGRDEAALGPASWLERVVADWTSPRSGLDLLAGDPAVPVADPGLVASASVEAPAAGPVAPGDRGEGVHYGMGVMAAAGLIVAVVRRNRRKGRDLPKRHWHEDGSNGLTLPASMT